MRIGYCIGVIAGILGFYASFLTVGTSYANPTGTHEFPDISTYTQIQPQPGMIARRDSLGNESLHFMTPEGMTCLMLGYGGVSCSGNYNAYLPQDYRDPDPTKCIDFGVISSPSTNPYAHAQFSGGATVSCDTPALRNLLLPHQKISYRGATCAVADEHILACRTGEHGFVLKPNDSWLF